MERLTKRNEEDTAYYYYPLCFKKCNGFGASEKCNKCELSVKVCEKLGEYEDAEEQGLLLKLPCKVGDTVYSVVKDGLSIFELEFSLDFYVRRKDDFGKTIFLTREEAERALKQMGE